MTKEQLEEFIGGYIECALWCGVLVDNGGDISTSDEQQHDESELTRKAVAELRRDAKSFANANASDIEASKLDMGQAGHDFWLTRNRHGAGYWDRKSPGKEADAALDRLTAAAHAYGSQDLELRRGKIHVA